LLCTERRICPDRVDIEDAVDIEHDAAIIAVVAT
jgi:hypothetical protein